MTGRRGEGSVKTREVSLLYLVKQVELAARHALDEVVEPAGLTTLQYTALTVLQRDPGITSADLARNSFVRTQTMAEMVAYLLDHGLVQRVRDESNRRQYLLTLSAAGAEVVESLTASAAAVERRMLSGLDDAQIDELRATLLRCRRSLTPAPLR